MRLAVVAHHPTPTNLALVEAARPDLCARILSPAEAADELTFGDAALARLDVAESIDGIESGLWELAHLPNAGVRLLNPPTALVAAHDKLATSRILQERRVPHPRTVHVTSPASPVRLDPPVVVKPRFGSWGRDVVLCPDRKDSARRCASSPSGRGSTRTERLSRSSSLRPGTISGS
jgi:glutathione synthase/RimK-type ligase-like ATP-grasp enzyme